MRKKILVSECDIAYHTPGTVPNMPKISKNYEKWPKKAFNRERMCDKY